MEFSKFLILIDYLIMLALIITSIFFEQLVTITEVWAGQLAISTGFYFWKARLENKVKLPMYMLLKLPKEFRDDVDMTEIIKSILGD